MHPLDLWHGPISSTGGSMQCHTGGMLIQRPQIGAELWKELYLAAHTGDPLTPSLMSSQELS